MQNYNWFIIIITVILYIFLNSYYIAADFNLYLVLFHNLCCSMGYQPLTHSCSHIKSIDQLLIICLAIILPCKYGNRSAFRSALPLPTLIFEGCIYIYIYIYICRVYLCMYAYMNACMHTHIHTHTSLSLTLM